MKRPLAQMLRKEHGFPIGLLELFQLALVLLPDILRLRPQGILHPPLAVLDPALNLGRRQVKLAGRL